MKSILAIGLILGLQLLVEGCGQDLGKTKTSFASDQRTGAAGPQAGGAADATAATPQPEPAAPVEEMCLGIAQHGDHQQCDEGDEQVGDQVAAGGEPAAPPAVVDPVAAPAPVVVPVVTPAPVPTPAPAPVPAKDPNIVEFHIKAGTGKSPWNTAAETVVVKVGQTLRLVNDDTVTHRLHTGGAPCPHGDNFAAGKTYDCKVTKALDPVKQPKATYDHIVGDTALFFLKAVP